MYFVSLAATKFQPTLDAIFWGRCWKISEECSLVLAVFQTLNWLGSVCQQIYGVFD